MEAVLGPVIVMHPTVWNSSRRRWCASTRVEGRWCASTRVEGRLPKRVDSRYCALFVLHPLVLRDSRRFQQVVQIVVVEADDLDEAEALARGGHGPLAFDLLGAPRSLVGVQDNSVLVEALAAPTRLLMKSESLYQREHKVAPAPEHPEKPHEAPAPAFPDEELSVASSIDETDKSLCYVCCLEKKDAVIMECGHGGICFECGKSLATRHPRTCPICRSPITAVLRVGPRERGSSLVVSTEGVVVSARPAAPPPASPAPRAP